MEGAWKVFTAPVSKNSWNHVIAVALWRDSCRENAQISGENFSCCWSKFEFFVWMWPENVLSLDLCGCVRGKGILGGKGCVDSAFPSVLLNSWALLTEFPCPAWDLAASLENSWIYFTLAILLHSVQIFALTLLVFGRSWPRVSCLIKITWIWNEAPAVGKKFLLAFLPLLSSLPKVFPPALGLQLWTSQISFERADFFMPLSHFPRFFSPVWLC